MPAPVAASAASRFLTQEAGVAELLDLADQRLALMPGVAATKWQHHAAVTDAARERVVIRHAGELAEPLGLAPQPVERVFEIQVREARELEVRLTQQWRAHGFRFAAAIPDLTSQVRPQLDTITSRMLRALYLAAPAFRRPDFAQHYAALANSHLRSAGWTNRSRRELLAALALVRTASAPSLQRIAASGVLRVGVTGDYPPFSLESAGALRGADIELAARLANHLHAQVVFVRTSWRSLLDDLHDGDFDIAMGGVSVSAQRQSRAALSIPYSSGGKTILARCTDAARFRDLAAVDRSQVRVIVNPGGTNEQFVRATLHNAQIRVYPDNRTIFDEIRAGRADVMITDDTEVELQTRRHPDLCRSFPGTLTRGVKAVLMPKDAALLAAVNEWLRGEIAAGVPARLIGDGLGD